MGFREQSGGWIWVRRMEAGFFSWLNIRIWGFPDEFWVTKERMGLGGTKPRMEAEFSYGV